MSTEWVSVDDIATELRYTKRQAWEYLRSIGLLTVNPRKMDLARFTRAEFDAARDRAKAPIEPRTRITQPAAVTQAGAPKGQDKAAVAAKLAKLRGA